MSNLPPLYDGIRTLILSARSSVVRGVDLIQVWTNFEIGRRIVAHEQHGADRAEYGKELLKELAASLTGEFGSGFSRSNLEYMRRFYLAYSDRLPQISQTPSGKLPAFGISQTPSGELSIVEGNQRMPFALSWSHYVFLLGVKNLSERSFYEK